MDKYLYKDYVINNIRVSKGIFVDAVNIIDSYKDCVYYIQYDQTNISKKRYLVAFLFDTVNGEIEISTYNYKLGRIKNRLHKELKDKYKKLKINNLYNLDLPYDILEKIEGYLF